MFTTFCESLIEEVGTKIGPDYIIHKNHVVKNNGLELDGIVILKKEERMAPTVYINDYFCQYEEGRSMDSIVKELIQIVTEEGKKKRPVIAKEFLSFSYMKDKIIYRLVNYEKNKSELEKIPHIRYLDLAITFHCLIKCEKEEIGTIRIQKEMMEQWNLSQSDIWELAKENTPKLFPIRIRTMNEVIADILQGEVEGIESEMFIFSNESGINGASVLLYEHALSNFAASYQSDFYILPSSIHEVILIPCQKKFSQKQLIEMVKDVNSTQVPMEDILSNQVYIYHRNQNIINM